MVSELPERLEKYYSAATLLNTNSHISGTSHCQHSCESAMLTRGDSRFRLPRSPGFSSSDNSRLAGWYENSSGHRSRAWILRLHSLPCGTKNGRGSITSSIFQAEFRFRDESFAGGQSLDLRDGAGHDGQSPAKCAR